MKQTGYAAERRAKATVRKTTDAELLGLFVQTFCEWSIAKPSRIFTAYMNCIAALDALEGRGYDRGELHTMAKLALAQHKRHQPGWPALRTIRRPSQEPGAAQRGAR